LKNVKPYEKICLSFETKRNIPLIIAPYSCYLEIISLFLKCVVTINYLKEFL
jgi:hypothetical protein